MTLSVLMSVCYNEKSKYLEYILKSIYYDLMFWSSYFIILICFLILQSRSVFFRVYIINFSIFDLLKIIIIGISLTLFLISPLGDKIYSRLQHAVVSIEIISSSETIELGVSDYKRNMLILSTIEIIKNNFWFGTGIGLENYRSAFHKYVSFYHHDSKAHNFYLSYFAELGIFGFILLILILGVLYKKLSKNKMYIAFRISFIGIAFMMTMNEYIGLPELWFFYGILIGGSINTKNTHNHHKRGVI